MKFTFKRHAHDAELEEFRSLMEVPAVFTEGFDITSLLGTLFVALVMVPGALYMQLVAGIGIGGAAQWVTVLLFVEVAKRANVRMSRAQLFILFYMSGMVMASASNSLLWRQFLVRSDAAVATGISALIPSWVAPADIEASGRTFFSKAWLPVIGLMLFGEIIGRIETMVLGYGLFRLTNDIEKLPFPMAPLGAQGIVSVAEQVEGATHTPGSQMRWRLFCIGAGVGMLFGVVYMALPTLTGAFFGNPISVMPIPWVDLTPYTHRLLPAVATGISFDLGSLILGMVLPFFAMVGSFVGLIITFLLNPILYACGQLPTWRPNDNTVVTLFSNNVDFYFSFGIGISLAIAVYGLSTVFSRMRKMRQKHETAPIPENRGDIKPAWIGTAYFFTVLCYILVSGWLIEWHRGVMIVLVFFGFFYTPLISYVTAKLEGMAGQVVEIPFITELSFILSGYRGVAVWFLPIPRSNYGVQTVNYKTAELLGCRFNSIWKSQIVLFPIVFLAMLGFSSFIWSLGPIPSAIYPYTDKMWDLTAKNSTLVYSATLGEYSPFQEALSLWKIIAGFFSGGIAIIGLYGFGAPTMLLFGIVRGLGQTLPHSVIPNFIGALIGRYYFQRRFGPEWRKMIPVASAGFFVGGGLISMLAVGLVFLSKSVNVVPY